MPLIDALRTHLENRAFEDLKVLLEQQDLFVLVEALEALPPEERSLVFRLLPKDLALDVFEDMEVWLQQELLSGFTEDTSVAVLAYLPADDRVRLLDELPAKVAKRLIARLPRDAQSDTYELLGYPVESAGRLMNPHFFSLRGSETVTQALERIREKSRDVETPYVLYVTDDTKRLTGYVTLPQLVAAKLEHQLGTIMNTQVVWATTQTDQEVAARLLQDRDLVSLPVVDGEHRLVGVIDVDDAMDTLEAETTEDIFDKAGLVALQATERSRSYRLLEGKLLDVWMARLPFLFITLAGGMLAGVVIARFESVLESIAFVAFFIPVIMDMGGNVGTQSSTIFTRALVLGQINLDFFLRNWLRELRNGASMGVVLGFLGGMIAWWWQGIPGLAWAVSISLFLTITLATGLGFFIPYVLHRLGLDQAAGSDPIITTIKDMSGLAIYFFAVSTLLSHLL